MVCSNENCNCHNLPEDLRCGCTEEGSEILCACEGLGPRLEGTIITCLLGLLRERETHGYELIEKLKKIAFINNLPDAGAIYRQLRRLKAEGLIDSKLMPGQGGPARTVYFLTEEGRRFLGNCVLSLHGIGCLTENIIDFLERKAGGNNGKE